MLWFLLEDIRTGLKELFEHTVYEQPMPKAGRQPKPGPEPDPCGDVLRSPAVYIGDLPPKRSDIDYPEGFPYILIRMPEGESRDDDMGRVHSPLVRIICGTWTDNGEEAQHQIALQSLFRVLQWFCETRLIFGRWERMFPLKWGFGVPSPDRYGDGGQPQQYSVAWLEIRFEARAETESFYA